MADKEQAVGQPIELPSLYVNGFQIGITNSDISGIMLLNGQPQMVMNLSYTTAKTLHKALGELISGLEEVTKRDIMVTSEIEKGLSEMAQKVQK